MPDTQRVGPRIDAECPIKITELRSCGCAVPSKNTLKETGHVFLEMFADITKGEGTRADVLNFLNVLMRYEGKYAGAKLPEFSMVEIWPPAKITMPGGEIESNTTGYGYINIRRVHNRYDGEIPLSMRAISGPDAPCDHAPGDVPNVDGKSLMTFIVNAEPHIRPDVVLGER